MAADLAAGGGRPSLRLPVRSWASSGRALLDVAPLTTAEVGRQVERAHRSHVQEFYDYYAGELSVAAVN